MDFLLAMAQFLTVGLFAGFFVGIVTKALRKKLPTEKNGKADRFRAQPA